MICKEYIQDKTAIRKHYFLGHTIICIYKGLLLMIVGMSKHNADTNLRAQREKGVIQLIHSRLGNCRIYCSLKLYFNYPSFN